MPSRGVFQNRLPPVLLHQVLAQVLALAHLATMALVGESFQVQKQMEIQDVHLEFVKILGIKGPLVLVRTLMVTTLLILLL